MTEKSFLSGDPKGVAEQVAPFVETGATHVAATDLMPLLLPPDEAVEAPDRSLELSRVLKQA